MFNYVKDTFLCPEETKSDIYLAPGFCHSVEHYLKSDLPTKYQQPVSNTRSRQRNMIPV